MADSVTRRTRNAQRQRATHDQARVATLQTAPTVAMRQRAFAAAVLDLPPAAVSDTLLQAVLDQTEALLAVVQMHAQHRDAIPPATYLAPFFGLRQPVQTRTQIAPALAGPATTVRNWISRDVAALRAYLAETAADLAQATACWTTAPDADAAFWDRVDRSGDCWLWQGATDLGYGMVKRQGKQQQAHRYVYTLAHGPLPTGVHVAHRCQNRRCVNPAPQTVLMKHAFGSSFCSHGNVDTALMVDNRLASAR